MTFESSNTKWIEQLSDDKLVQSIRTAMKAGCITPAHVYDLIDEVLQRFQNSQAMRR